MLIIPTVTEPQPIDYATSAERRGLRLLSVAAIIIAVTTTGVTVWLTFAELWPIPVGTPIRPMGLVLNVFLIAIATLISGAALGVIAIMVGRRDRVSILLAIVAILASMAPLPALRLTSDWIAARHGLVWES
jgi:hypothetical protein